MTWRAWEEPVVACQWPLPEVSWNFYIERIYVPSARHRRPAFRFGCVYDDETWILLLSLSRWQRDYPLWHGAYWPPPRWWRLEMNHDLAVYEGPRP